MAHQITNRLMPKQDGSIAQHDLMHSNWKLLSARPMKSGLVLEFDEGNAGDACQITLEIKKVGSVNSGEHLVSFWDDEYNEMRHVYLMGIASL